MFVEKIRFADKGGSVMKQTVVGLVVFLLPVIFSNVLASDEAHHIKDAAGCKEIIEHHCAAVNSEKDVEMCLVAWYQEHHLKHDADAAALTCRCWSFCAA